MHIFCSYGPWEDIAAIVTGGILVQEKRCEVCNKVRRRQTTHLGGTYDKPIISRGHKPRSTDSQKKTTLPAKDVFLAGYHTAEDFFSCSSTEQEAEEHWKKYLDSRKQRGTDNG